MTNDKQIRETVLDTDKTDYVPNGKGPDDSCEPYTKIYPTLTENAMIANKNGLSATNDNHESILNGQIKDAKVVNGHSLATHHSDSIIDRINREGYDRLLENSKTEVVAKSLIDLTDTDNHTEHIVNEPKRNSKFRNSSTSVIIDPGETEAPFARSIPPTTLTTTKPPSTTPFTTKDLSVTSTTARKDLDSLSTLPEDPLVVAMNGNDRPPNDVIHRSPNDVTDPSSQSTGEDLSVNTWQKISVLVCVFVLLREFHPIESYFVKYLETLDSSYTRDVVRRSIYPVGTYSSLLLMVITFLITDYTRYKPIVLLDVLAGLFSYVLILNNPSMPVMWVQQVCIGFYHAGEVSYYSYMYSKIKDKASYQCATGRVKASIMIGRFITGVTGQSVVLLFDTAVGYKILVYLSILGMAGATVWTCLLPAVEDSVYFHQPPASESSHLQPAGKSISNVAKTIWSDFKTAFSQVEILKWSLWWVLGMGGYILVITYNQVLWSSLVNEDPKNNRLMNGAVDAVFTIAGAISTFSIGKVSLNWNRYGELMLAGGTLIQGTLLILTHSSHSLNQVYVYYIVFGCIHYTMLTIASSEIAKYLKRESFALVFGFNKFIALLSVSLFTVSMVQIKDTPTRTLYLLFGVYFLSIGFIYCLVSLSRTIRTLRTMVSLS